MLGISVIQGLKIKAFDLYFNNSKSGTSMRVSPEFAVIKMVRQTILHANSRES
jgi:hypothetical protein